MSQRRPATHTEATYQNRSERAPCGVAGGAVIGSPELARSSCKICGTPLTGRQKSACSPEHRAALSRRKRAPRPVAGARTICASLTAALEAVGEAKAALDQYMNG
jgi:hypothetical protein